MLAFTDLLSLTTVVLAGSAFQLATGYSYSTKYFEVPLDHFSFATNTTFKIRYLYNDTHWRKESNGPIFFYTGNEGNVENFANNTGFMWETAKEFGAMVVFAEHRFYGLSLPGGFSFASPDSTIFGYLTIEQTLADYAKLLTWLKKSLKSESSPVISFGGSYGGQLTAYFRMKYPHIVQGGIASSAPLFLSDAQCELHDKTLNSIFQGSSPGCADSIRKSWPVINRVTKSGKGKQWLADIWKLCDPLDSDDSINNLKYWLETMYSNLGMVNYPYPANFLHDLPGNPVKVFCSKLGNDSLGEVGLSKDQILLMKLFGGVNVYFNYTGSLGCFNSSDISDTSSVFSSMDSLSFAFQSCTELIDPDCDDGIQDFFEPSPWDLKQYTEDCREEFNGNISPQPGLLDLFYGGKNILAASNILFSNGKLDPWYRYGVLKNLSDSLLAIVIEDSAHHLDLRATNPLDPPTVRIAREFEKEIIRRWINDYHKDRKHLEELFSDTDIAY